MGDLIAVRDMTVSRWVVDLTAAKWVRDLTAARLVSDLVDLTVDCWGT